MDRLSAEACQPIWDALGIEFTPEQLRVAQDCQRFPVISGGERGGKSFVTAAILAPHIIMLPYIRRGRFFTDDGKLAFDGKTKPSNPDFVLFGPNYAEPRVEFGYLEQYLTKLGVLDSKMVSKPNDGAWRLTTKQGVSVTTWSMEDPTGIRAVDLEAAVICESGKAPYSGIERVQGRVSAKKGFIIYSGTLENSQRWYQEWALMGQRDNHLGIKSYSLPTWTNFHEFPGGRNDPEILRLEAFYPEDIFAMRVAAEARPPRSRVLNELTTAHVRAMKIPKDANIEVWIDPGYASAYALLWVAWWEEEDGRKFFYVFDEFYEQRKTTNDMIDMCKASRYWNRVEKGVIDIGSKGHRDATESSLEHWKARTKVRWQMKLWRENALIERIRVSAKSNQIAINPLCKGLLAESGLGEVVFPEMFYWQYPTDRDGRVISERPIDKWNHSAKALGYGLLHHLGHVERVRKPPTNYNRMRKRGFNSNAAA